MGYGDEILGSGVARSAHARGKRIAFGDGKHIIWHANAHQIFKNNPNVARPGEEAREDLEWVAHYPGNRLYHRGRKHGQWLYSDFRATPGEMFFDDTESATSATLPSFDVVIEPTVKAIAPNKQWPVERYQVVVDTLGARGLNVVQLLSNPGQHHLRNVVPLVTQSFRLALAVLGRARAYIGPEGGLHHGAAALGVRGVVIFGGFTHPRNTGYDLHTNIFIGDEPCGRQAACEHCKAAMASISVEQVLEAAHAHLT